MNSIEKNAKLKEKFNAVSVYSFGKEPVEKSRLAVFDFDETLVKSQEMFYILMEDAMKRLNLPHSEYILKNVFANWDKEYFGWGKDLEEQKQIYVKKYQPLVTKLSNEMQYIKQMYFYDNMKSVIKSLAKTDIALAIASSRDLTSILTFMKMHGMRDYFSIIEATEGGKNFDDKPNTAIVNYIAQEVGIPLDRSVMIGDSPCDIQMGKDAGMKTIAVGYNKEKSKVDFLAGMKPDAMIDKEEYITILPFAITLLLSQENSR